VEQLGRVTVIRVEELGEAVATNDDEQCFLVMLRLKDLLIL
jgi:hypothetical protein